MDQKINAKSSIEDLKAEARAIREMLAEEFSVGQPALVQAQLRLAA